jgi:ribosome-binding factor A
VEFREFLCDDNYHEFIAALPENERYFRSTTAERIRTAKTPQP